MGHGFSRMLQLVNNDLLKSVEMIREPNKGYLSDEEKILNSNSAQKNLNNTSTTGIKETVKLPKVGKRRMKTNVTNTENGANASSNTNINNNSSNVNPYENAISTEDEPRVMKIYKKNKNFSSIDNTNKFNE
jgi:hypothetical protein